MIDTTRCHYCHSVSTIVALAQFELPARAVFTERMTTLKRCTHCLQLHLSLYEESRAGATDTEIWNVYNYSLGLDLQRDLLIAAAWCDNPNQAHCTCVAHHLMNQLDFSKLKQLRD
ncbi:MAG: hypothetical protein HYV33_04055 [Candidatus Kerfeldbacteria bacterium]|nr:hypothetical protein [Candidatus Kerfeldbacteria bacterium]